MIALALLVMGTVSPGRSGPGHVAPIVGALEDVEVAGREEGHLARRVRTLFRYDGHKWMAYPHRPRDQRELRGLAGKFPPSVSWTICHDGKALGVVVGRASRRWGFYGQVGLQEPIPDSVAPSVGEPSRRFAGDSELPVHHPLVATTGRCRLDGWALVPSLPKEVQDRVIAALPDPGASQRRVTSYAWPASYRGPEGSWIVEVHRSVPRLTERRVVFVGPEGTTVAAGEPGSHVGLSDDTGPLAPGRISPQLIVDIGDWNGDGKSEVLTKFERDNLEGYILLSSSGQALATFDWNYH